MFIFSRIIINSLLPVTLWKEQLLAVLVFDLCYRYNDGYMLNWVHGNGCCACAHRVWSHRIVSVHIWRTNIRNQIVCVWILNERLFLIILMGSTSIPIYNYQAAKSKRKHIHICNVYSSFSCYLVCRFTVLDLILGQVCVSFFVFWNTSQNTLRRHTCMLCCGSMRYLEKYILMEI